MTFQYAEPRNLPSWRTHLRAVVIGISMLAWGCSPPGPVAQECLEPARSFRGSVAGSFLTTVGALRAVQLRYRDEILWRSLGPDHPAILCYIDGEAGGPEDDPFDRALVGYADDSYVTITAGHWYDLPIESP